MVAAAGGRRQATGRYLVLFLGSLVLQLSRELHAGPGVLFDLDLFVVGGQNQNLVDQPAMFLFQLNLQNGSRDRGPSLIKNALDRKNAIGVGWE